MTIRKKELIRALKRQSFPSFLKRVFEALHPGKEMVSSWYIESMCHYLTEVAEGRVDRLLITMPPRYGKSIATAVALPAFMLGQDPTHKILVASYGIDLANKHSGDFRTIVTSDWYKELFPKVRLKVGGNRADEQITTMGGGRKGVTVGGSVTGFGANTIVVDDLMKAADVSSEVERERASDYYQQTLLSRFDEKKDGRVVVIQQRLHEDDLPGRLIESGQFTHLNLPAIATRDEEIPIGFGLTHQRRKGDVLCPEREPLEVLERTRREMGNYHFSAQYQQNPTPLGGNRIRWEWFGQYQPDEEFRRGNYQYIAQSWDTGFSSDPKSDFSVGLTWGLRDGGWRLLDCSRARLDFPDLKRRVDFLANRFQADIVLIEHAGSGISLLQQLRQDNFLHAFRYNGVTPRLDKQMRLEAQTARLEDGKYLLPPDAPWLEELRRELLGFPNGKHDDQVDALVQFVEWSASSRGEALPRCDPKTGRPRAIRLPSIVRPPSLRT